MNIQYYVNLSNYLLHLQAQLPHLSLSSQEQSYLSQAISSLYELTMQQIWEMQNES